MKNITIGVMALLWSATTCAANVIADKDSVYLVGAIKEDDDRQFGRVLKTNDSKIVFVDINSEGGNVEAAIKIGRIIRREALNVIVGNNAQCASACIYILASGVNRIIHENARVIIHRPFIDGELSHRTGYDDTYKRIVRITREYFTEMNIPIELVDRMMAIPPYEARELSRAELKQYMLDGADPGYEQKELSLEAKKRGISVSQLNQRKAISNKLCSVLVRGKTEKELSFFYFVSYESCSEAILQGQSSNDVANKLRTVIERKDQIGTLSQKAQESCIGSIFLPESGEECALRF